MARTPDPGLFDRPDARGDAAQVSDPPDDTRYPRPSSHWDADQRALVGRARRTAIHGVPIVESGQLIDDLTPVFDLLAAELDADDHEVVRRSRRAAGDPALVADIVKLGQRLLRVQREQQSSTEAGAAELRALLDRPSRNVADQLQDRCAELERHVASHRRLIRWVAGAALASLVTVGGFLYTRGVAEGGDRVRLEHAEKAIDELRALGRHISTSTTSPPAVAPDVLSSASTTKDQTP